MTDDVGDGHPGTAASGIESAAPADTALLLDVMLGKLAVYLRMCGYDTAYALDSDGEDPGDDALLERAEEEKRVLLTRDVALAERAARSVLLTGRSPPDQLSELLAVGFELSLSDKPARCGSCNGVVNPIEEGESVPAYAPDADAVRLWKCRDCGQVFWRGSHWDDVETTLKTLETGE
ncbi:Mut7-C RNAse domain-containing protein [Haloferax namakaokahaiae]|uniref:Mut7-C RNAse domain-containing protein n=1 Tax=Haloferax namakaokahaiae TaxID=1748331 RepID=A0ABD5ZGL4_9EURY